MEGVQFGSVDEAASHTMDVREDSGHVAKHPVPPSKQSSDGGGDTMEWFSPDANTAFRENVTRGCGDASFADAPFSPILARKKAPVFDDQEFVPDELKVPAEAETIVGDLGFHRGYVFRKKADSETGAASEKNVAESCG
ncbi:hypothetical protein HPB52_024928 [Rhipicephalus sanguineus]|uniref:Uncharacterized protein n=1 Tax=Rhipicephalus sanguineus TaxID=34632 RepID=A0A9D4TDL3_RHISA|nr:hypothetical protein HPB52_024928 [Rhipicephalus sanguineus]